MAYSVKHTCRHDSKESNSANIRCGFFARMITGEFPHFYLSVWKISEEASAESNPAEKIKKNAVFIVFPYEKLLAEVPLIYFREEK